MPPVLSPNNQGALLRSTQLSKPLEREVRLRSKANVLFIVRIFSDVPMVTLLVGEAEVPFHVHMDILCRASPVFKSAFMGEFAEASERSMTLPDDDPDAFESLVQWIYFKKYKVDPAAVRDSVEKTQELYMNLVDTYVLADKYNVLDLKNEIMDQLVDCCAGGELYLKYQIQM